MNNLSPLVSVIIPAYNSEAFLKACILSVINQTYSNLEIIIVNDGSTDGTTAIIEKYISVDARVKILNKKNEGLALARKTGLGIAQGEYIQHLDSDDTLLENAIESLVAKAEETNADIVAAPFYFYVGSESKKQSVSLCFSTLSGIAYFKEILHNRAYWSVWSNFQRHSFLKNCSLTFVPGVDLGEDAIMMTQLLSYAQKVVSIDIPILNYMIRPSSLSNPEIGKVSDKTYNDMRAYSAWIENYFFERGLLCELEEEMALMHLDHTFLGMYWQHFENAHADLRKAASDLRKYPSLKKRLRKRQLKLLFAYQFSSVLGDLYLFYYRCRGKI